MHRVKVVSVKYNLRQKLIGFQSNVRFIICTHRPTNFQNLLKVGPGHSEIFGGICQFLPYFDARIQRSNKICKIRPTGPKFAKFLYDVARSLRLLMHPSTLGYPNPFQDAIATNE